MNDFQILKFDLVVINEINAEKCKAKIKLIKQESVEELNAYSLSIDTTDFSSDLFLNADELEIGCILDIHYTNKSGLDQDLCYKLKPKVFIKLIQPVHISLNHISDFK